jgi:SAM-dependent methyltransferase
VLRAEAAWLAVQLERLPAQDLSPLLSIGSGDAALRATQPWIERLVYGPLSDRGVRLLHHELQPAPGVDVAGDLTDARFLGSLAGLEVQSIMCCNVLEHVPDPAVLAAAIERLVPRDGYAFVTVPYRYPYHPGPIDTMFRPSVDELRRLFPSLSVEREAEIRCESLIGYFLASPTKRSSLAHGLHVLKRDGHGDARSVPLRETARMLLSSTSVSAVILRRR